MSATQPPGNETAQATDGAAGAVTPRLLLVDDSPIVCAVVAEQLEGWGFAVETAESGAEALAALRAHGPFDTLICDVAMPEMDGLEVLRQASALVPDLPVIMLSAHSEVGLVLDAVRQGAFDYVVKDDELAPLRSALGRSVAHARLVRENRSLVAELKEINAHLEQRVNQRTAEVVATHAELTRKHTELERTLEELAATHVALVQSEKMATLGLLAAGIAHEINNPLAFVLPGLKRLQAICAQVRAAGGAFPGDPQEVMAEIAETLADAVGGLQRIAELVRELRAFAAPQGAAFAPVSLAEIVRSVVRLAGSQLQRARISVDAPEDLPEVRGDAALLRQLVLGLLLRAAKAVAARREDGDVRVVLEPCAEGVALRVEDNSRTGAAPGSADDLGLLASEQLAQRLGARLTSAVAAAGGTVVAVILPPWAEAEPS